MIGGTVTWNTPDHLLLDKSSNIGPLISGWELDFRNCKDKSFKTSKILTHLYQQFSNLLISHRDMSGPRLGALSNNRWSGGSSSTIYNQVLVLPTTEAITSKWSPKSVGGTLFSVIVNGVKIHALQLWPPPDFFIFTAENLVLTNWTSTLPPCQRRAAGPAHRARRGSSRSTWPSSWCPAECAARKTPTGSRTRQPASWRTGLGLRPCGYANKKRTEPIARSSFTSRQIHASTSRRIWDN